MDDKGHCYYAVMSNETGKCSYEEIYRWVCRVPEGKVVSYGQIARLVAGRCSARQVGYAMAAAPSFIARNRTTASPALRRAAARSSRA